MSYVKPSEVNSPKNRWRLAQVLHEGGAGGWAVAEGQWDENGRWGDVLAIRWNGTNASPIGNPQSRGLATWFIVPDELESAIRKKITELQREKALS